MKKLLFIFGAIAILTSCKNNGTTNATENNAATNAETKIIDSENHGDALKSASYEVETTMPAGMGTTKTKTIFDDYGKKSRTVIQSSISFGGKAMNSASNNLLLDGYVYNWQTDQKTGMKFKLDETKMDLKNTDFSRLSEEMKKKLNFKMEGKEDINGKECTVASFSSEQMQGKVWVWKQIPMKTELNVVGKTITSKLISLDENPSIPSGTFEIPSDVLFNEMQLPATAEK
ncbi:MAG: hypothetical protein RJA25_942 [Bacteroidota bacterium]|jgi:outer membrane lipoprotein-sorting protein